MLITKTNLQLSPHLWSFIWQFLKPYRSIVILYVSIAMLAGCWSPFNGLLFKRIINDATSVSTTGDLHSLAWPAVLLVLNFIVFDNVTWRMIGYLNYKYQPVIKNQIISETFRFVLGASQQFFHDNLSGRISSQINTLADNIELIINHIAANFIRGFSLLSVALISMYSVNLKFFCILGAWFLAFASFSIVMSRRLVILSDAHTEAEAITSGQLVDSIANVNTVRIFARRPYEIQRIATFLSAAKKAFQDQHGFLVLLNCIQGTLIATMLGFMIYFLIHLYSNNLITIGDFALILGLSMEVAHITWYTMGQIADFNQAVGKCKQSLTSLIVPRNVKEKHDARQLNVIKGQITFKNVKFHYKGTEPLFQNKSVTIKAGQKVGLVGYSGSGKSTFINLILRIYDVTDGAILIDDQDIRDVTKESLGNQIAIIPQDPSLFNRTLMENIRYGRVEATDGEVIEAAKKAHAHEFISKLPQGYESLVGERGIKLSGGQRQRIAIARAILKNAPILILDEATSQLDSLTESDIQESLWELMQNKTTIVIAHRLSTLLNMNRILVFDKGKIVGDGTHTTLLTKSDLYKNLWEAQVGGFLPDENGEYEEDEDDQPNLFS